VIFFFFFSFFFGPRGGFFSCFYFCCVSFGFVVVAIYFLWSVVESQREGIFRGKNGADEGDISHTHTHTLATYRMFLGTGGVLFFSSHFLGFQLLLVSHHHHSFRHALYSGDRGHNDLTSSMGEIGYPEQEKYTCTGI
jgi:hypothetical protein